MDRATQTALLKRLLIYVETKTTALAAAPWLNDVSAYHSRERAEREQAALFRQRPVLMGLSCDWSKPGDYRTDDHTGVPILIVRGRDSTLRAFLNVCRHRGAKVAQGCGKASVFTCPYHAWTYDVQGALRGIPDEGSFPGIRAERGGLTPLPLAEKHGMVWVVPSVADDRAATFDVEPWLGGLGPELASYGIGSYHAYDRRVIREEMNWKILADTFFESYHIQFLHKDSLTAILHSNMADFEAFGANFRLTFPRTKLERLRTQPEETWDAVWNTAMVYSLFANTVLVMQGDHIELFRIFPVDGRPDLAAMETTLYVPTPVETADQRRHWDANMDLVMKVVTTEDFPAGRTMQIGFGSGAQNHVVYGRNEPALIHFHQAIRRAIGLPVEAKQVEAQTVDAQTVGAKAVDAEVTRTAAE